MIDDYEAFVYKWINKKTGEWYIGYHKGHIDDGYISSGKYFLEKYSESPEDFERIILAKGKMKDMYNYETNLLVELDARNNNLSYNKHNNNFPYLPADELSQARKQYYKDNPEALIKMSEKRKQYFKDNPSFSLKWSGEKNPAKKIENRIKISEGLKKAFENTDIRLKMSRSAKIRANLPENKQKMMGDNNPAKKIENRIKMSISQKQYYKDNPNAYVENSKRRKQYYKDNPEAIIRMSEQMKNYNNNNKFECEICNKILDKGNYYKWHGIKCKKKQTDSLEKFFK